MSRLINLAIVLFFAGQSAWAAESASEARLDEVEHHGRHVMPFNLEQTLHVFSKTPSGGIQKVVAKEALDSEQINLIRAHLSKIAG